ncbi:hypothetical protein HRED_01756 [Candidatus Haloredivivus sp. G17]|jgi:hypothetical protein|nr:hypothetical protein HRED_01756 [Candidatus Haloredivivus sp. G17]
MKDLWTITAYPAASVAGYFAAIPSREFISAQLGLKEWASTVLVLVVVGLVVGFLVDEVIPTYIHEVRQGGNEMAGGGDIGGGGDFDGGDFDFE